MQLSELVHYTDVLLEAPRFRDYCPNGLQVEGRPEVRRIVTGVTACFDLLRAAVDAGADAILVHHGYFWRNDDPRVTGFRRQRLQWLLRHELSLIAYHLPLDAHRTLGNNVQLGARLGLDSAQWFGEQDVATLGRLPEAMTLGAFADRVETCLGRKPLVVGDGQRMLGRLAWCTGAAQGYMEEAVRLGADAYLTGEISEQTVHLARETGVALIAAGHHATERYGIQALGAHLAEQFGLAHEFIDIPNPV